MKKLIILIMLGVIIGAGYVNLNDLPFKVINKSEQKQLAEYKEQVKVEKELSKLHDPTIIQQQIRSVGKLTVLEGEMQYLGKITDKGILDITLREITLDLWWQYAICMPLQYIKVKEINNNEVVIIQIPVNRMQLQYIQLDQSRSKIIDGKKMLFVNQFKPSEVEIIIEQSQQQVANKIGNSPELFYTALDNLEFQLEEFIKGFGYNQIKFERV